MDRILFSIPIELSVRLTCFSNIAATGVISNVINLSTKVPIQKLKLSFANSVLDRGSDSSLKKLAAAMTAKSHRRLSQFFITLFLSSPDITSPKRNTKQKAININGHLDSISFYQLRLDIYECIAFICM